MRTRQTNRPLLEINSERLLAVVQDLLDGTYERPRDDQPVPPGPSDPVIRATLRRMDVLGSPSVSWEEFILGVLARTHPEVSDIPRGGGNIFDKVALNPQPLPPRWAFFESLTQTVVERAELIQEIAMGLSDGSEERGIIIVSGYISRFIDEFCGTGYRLRFPHPGPRPKWFPHQLEGIDLVVMAANFSRAARETHNQYLSEQLRGASAKLLEAGFSKML